MAPKAQMKQFADARGLLLDAADQYERVRAQLAVALDSADAAMSTLPDPEAHDRLKALREVLAGLPTSSIAEGFVMIAETLLALSYECSAHEEHVPAGVS